MVNQTKAWYKKPTSIIILLILFFPIGLYLMWKNLLWTKTIRWIVSIIFLLIIIINIGGTQQGVKAGPTGIYYGGEWDDPDEFYYEFKENGSISICRGSLYERNCCADGNWAFKDNSIIISGISNVNCPEMSTLNGTYSSCNKPDCIPSGKAYKMGNITIWPEKK